MADSDCEHDMNKIEVLRIIKNFFKTFHNITDEGLNEVILDFTGMGLSNNGQYDLIVGKKFIDSWIQNWNLSYKGKNSEKATKFKKSYAFDYNLHMSKE